MNNISVREDFLFKLVDNKIVHFYQDLLKILSGNTHWKYSLKILIENNFRDLAAFTFSGIPFDTKFFYIFVYIVFTTGIPLEENDENSAM